ncbi:MAG: preprotein translocase subunit SecD, partial [Actinomycetota bacterium]
MKQRRNALSLFIIVAVALGSITFTLVKHNKPTLGLDLQGGISLVLTPAKKVDTGVLKQSIAIIRNRVDALGVGEPEISRQGQNIVVELPGVKNQEKARQIIGQTAELRFRPVLQGGIAPEDYVPPKTTTTTAKATKGATTTTADPAAPTTTTSTTAKPAVIPSTKPDDDAKTATVLLPQKDRNGKEVQRFQLGPTLLTGTVVRTASAKFQQEGGTWFVQLQLTGKGSPQFDAMAA